VLTAITLVGAAEKNPLVPSSNELIWGTIAFLILLFVLSKLVFPRVTAALQGRTDKIQGDLDQAEQDKQEATRLLADYRAQLQAAREESNRIMEDARKSADQVRKDLLEKAEAEANRVIQRAQEEIQAERDRAISDVRREAASLALQLAEKVIGETMDEARQLRLVDRYIEELSPGA
jgi:F-type H+-transporting ATPase subunit b